ncbi:hypothetical protein [Macrococcoides caseolyticum]|uniref:hypothetical protein n=1 Tax=Macrococcoides caseolyticum TaxID=69966 RepID=UPI003F606EE3
MELLDIEKLEQKYLEKYYYFLKYALDEILIGFDTKNKIKDDWIKEWLKNIKEDKNKGISDFAVGAERIIYAMLNGKGIGQPNSSPIGSDLFFEVHDAFIHIDLKTVQTDNIGDYTKNIFVGNNQNSYKTKVKVGNIIKEYKESNLPKFYTYSDDDKKIVKPCLTYFITILYEAKNLKILNINLLNMPNGVLEEIYGGEILQAGKVDYPVGDERRGKYMRSIRYKWTNCIEYKLLENKKRYKSIYYDQFLVEELFEKGLISENSKKLLNQYFLE